MEVDQKLCSVVIPTYRCGKTVGQTVASALDQTYRNIEILIVDDASNDDTASVLQALAQRDSRIHVFFMETNGGVANARNFLFSHVHGDYVAFLDSDDLWLPEKLEKQIALLEKTGCDLVYSSYSFIDGEGKSIGHPKIVPKTCTFNALLKDNYILPSTVVLRASWVKTHRMDGSYSHEDFVFWLDLLQDGVKAIGISESLILYRISENNRSGNKAKAAKNRWIVYRKFLHYSQMQSLWYFSQYAIKGFLKYRGIKKG